MAKYGNVLKAIDGQDILCPSSYSYNEQDVSASDAGRTEDVTMYKNRVGMCVKLELEWQNVFFEDAKEILALVRSEYVQATYFNFAKCDYVTSTFYVGDRKVEAYNAALGIAKSVSFNLVERNSSL
jgi:cbb3-type cytochrome oxidase subunit 1